MGTDVGSGADVTAGTDVGAGGDVGACSDGEEGQLQEEPVQVQPPPRRHASSGLSDDVGGGVLGFCWQPLPFQYCPAGQEP